MSKVDVLGGLIMGLFVLFLEAAAFVKYCGWPW